MFLEIIAFSDDVAGGFVTKLNIGPAEKFSKTLSFRKLIKTEKNINFLSL